MLRELNENEMEMVSGGTGMLDHRVDENGYWVTGPNAGEYALGPFDPWTLPQAGRASEDGSDSFGTPSGLWNESDTAAVGAVAGALTCSATGVGVVGSGICGAAGGWLASRIDDLVLLDLKHGVGRPNPDGIPRIYPG